MANSSNLVASITSSRWEDSDDDVYMRALSAIQNISTIRRARTARILTASDSRGARLQALENSIATLDSTQEKAVIETSPDVQRIRGLAGSGKTIVLALKAAYLHAQHPEWRIAVTFNTRSLKDQFRKLINNFCVEQTGEEPNWENLRIINAWGAPGGPERDGVFHEFCKTNGIEYLDFGSAKERYGRDDAFRGVCGEALKQVSEPKVSYQAILIDEAQDFPAEFLRLSYSMLGDVKRLVYAYDELQTLSGDGIPSPAEIFGTGKNGKPLVYFDEDNSRGPRRDIILEKCYRNSRPVLVSAHGLGFGIYREPTKIGQTGIVQMFDQPDLWLEIGYEVNDGQLSPGHTVELERTPDTSPRFLEEHSPVDDLLMFKSFSSKKEQDEWIASEIAQNINSDDLRYDDVIVVNTDPISTRRNLGPIRKMLVDQEIQNHLAGVDVSTDTFFKPSEPSITFTGIHRAKGNEAGMVYIVNAHECQASSINLARVRNRLFTAITRSKAWVRVVGVGPEMEALIDEYQKIKEASFRLRFEYPTEKQRAQLQILHRDATADQLAGIEHRRGALRELFSDIKSGKMYREDLTEEDLAQLRDLLESDSE
ncbi:DEAD/DEAH box helicase [Rhodococcus erythropolis]